MAFDPAPGSWITGWSEDGTDITFPMDSIPYLIEDYADATTGDWRMCIALLLEHSLNYYLSLDPADRPTQITLESSLFVDSNGDIFRTISLTSKVTTLWIGSTFSPDPE